MSEMYTRFSEALLRSHVTLPEHLQTWNGSSTTQRFNVYRNNVVHSLLGILKYRFDVTRQLLGNDFFVAMARLFIQAHPPQSPLIFLYGDLFADFVEHFQHTQVFPYLPDLCRLEFALHQAAYCADIQPLQADHLSAALVQVSQFSNLRLQFHPSVALIQSNFAIASVWGAHTQGGNPSEIMPHLMLSQPESVLIHLERSTPSLIVLSEAAAIFVGDCLSGSSLLDAVALTAKKHKAFDLPAVLSVLVQTGALIEPDFGVEQ